MEMVELVSKKDLPIIAWERLKLYLNEDYLCKLIIAKKGCTKKDVQNVKKQARQINYILSLAKEYFEASQSVSYFSRPVLLYYSAMHLALAEILFKGDGLNSLDAARAEHRHHGLQCSYPQKASTPLKEKLTQLKATPFPTGTFGLWQSFARHSSLGFSTEIDNGETKISGTHLVFIRADEQLPKLSKEGFSLLDCFLNLPFFKEAEEFLEESSRGLRVRCELLIKEETHNYSFIIQNFEKDLYDEIFSKLRISDDSPEGAIIKKAVPGNGFLVKVFESKEHQNLINAFPDGIALDKNTVWLFKPTIPVNEFGIYYIGLFILGNIARYFPDYWGDELSSSTTFAYFTNQLIERAAQRVPLLTLGEFRDTLFIEEN